MKAVFPIILNFLFKFLLMIGVIGIFLTSFNSFYWLDDFWKINFMASEGYFGTLKWFFVNWDGRAISPIYWIRNLFLLTIPYKFSFIATLVSLTALFFSAFYVAEIIDVGNLTNKRKSTFWFTLTIFVLIWISFAPHLSRSVYWTTGSFYNYSNLGLLIFLFLLVTKEKISIPELVVCFIIGLSGINISLVMISAIVLSKFLKVTSISYKGLIHILTVVGLSFILVFIAPGNFKRGAGEFDFVVFNILKNYLLVWKEFILMSKWLFISAIVFSLVDFSQLNKPKLGYYSFLFFCLAAVYLVPFAFFGSGAPKHTAITFQTLLWLSLVNLCWYLKSKTRFNFSAINKIGLAIVLVFVNFSIFHQLLLGRDIKQKIDQRYRLLESKRGVYEIVKLEIIEVQSGNFTNRFWDFDKYPKGSSDRYLEEYFEVQEIVVKEEK